MSTEMFITTHDFGYASAKKMAMQKAVAGTAVAAVVVLMMTSALALLQPSKTITHNGSIQAINVDVYQDSGCTQPLSTLSWGTLRPGTSANKTIYVKNLGNTALSLNMTVTAWNPAIASSYITLTWDREGSLVTPGNKAQALLVLSVSADVAGFTNFSLGTIIKGTEQT